MKKMIILFCFILTGCSRPSVMTITLKTSHDLNPDLYNRPKPLVVTLYSLTKPIPFKTTQYSKLMSNAVSALTTALIDKTSVELKPASSKNIKIDLTTNTQFIGIIASYHDINASTWRTLLCLKDYHWPSHITLYFGSNHIGLKEKGLEA